MPKNGVSGRAGGGTKEKILHIVKLAIFMEVIYFVSKSSYVILTDLRTIYFSLGSLKNALLGIYGVCGVGWFVYSLLMC